MSKLINHYKNGNVTITLFDDGTRVCETDDNYFDFDFPISMDCKITNMCPIGCKFCHEKSTPDGKHGNIMKAEFIDKLHPGTEIAIGGGAVTTHPDLIPFLQKLKDIGVVANITVNQKEYENNIDLIHKLINDELIHGLGVSFVNMNDNVWDEILKYPNVVVHLIAGIHGGDVFDYLARKKAKVLVLGYKDFGRGHDFLEHASAVVKIQLNWLKNNIAKYIQAFAVTSFDNLAIKQLEIRKQLTENEWKEFYQGDDGSHTMYVDLVNEQFAKTSTSTTRYPLLSNIEGMFKIIKKDSKNQED